MAYLRGDVVIDRVNALTTTLLDTAGVLSVAFGAGWAVWGCPWRQALAATVAGLIVMLLSGLAQRRPIPKPAEPEPAGVKPLPGPEDAGTLHIAGR